MYNLKILKDPSFDFFRCTTSASYNSGTDLVLSIQIKADQDGDLTSSRYREFLNLELFDDNHDGGSDPRVNIVNHILIVEDADDANRFQACGAISLSLEDQALSYHTS